MKSSFLIIGSICVSLCLVLATAGVSGVVIQSRECNHGLCTTNLVRRDDVNGEEDGETEIHDGSVPGDSDQSPNGGEEGNVEPTTTDISQPTPTTSDEDSNPVGDTSTPTASYQDGNFVADTPTPTVSTLWDADGNAFVFPSTSWDGQGSPWMSTPTPFTTSDEYGNPLTVTPTPIVTLWDDNGNEVIFTPTITAPSDDVSSTQPTEVASPVDQPTELPTSDVVSTETSSAVPEIVDATNASTNENLDTSSNEQTTGTSSARNMPVIIGGSVGALALVIGIGGFVGYRAVRNRRKSQWFKPEYNRDTKGFFDLNEVAEIASHSPGMNTPMPIKNHSVPPTVPPLISRQSFISTQSLVSPSVPPVAKKASTYNGLSVPPFAQPCRTSTQSSVGIRESALEETFIVGFTDFDDDHHHKDSSNYRLSTSPSVNINESNVVLEEPLFVMTALLPYMPQRTNEMLVQSGDEIVITEEVGEEWLGGYNKSRDPDTKGYFPRTCVTGTSYL
ncbi:hypothetical protein K7432_005902 [Basidiobolus ranarum]|uniref:SH3 domain-containing protein n=1 Tax=Basidiobolus ranarum TaxID=34480 RepID=A0ABR2W2I3_9FUNG